MKRLLFPIPIKPKAVGPNSPFHKYPKINLTVRHLLLHHFTCHFMTTLMGRRGVLRTAAKFAAAGMRGAGVADEAAAVSWEMEDWEVPDCGEVHVLEATPTVVVADVPTFQEATAATTELKHALHKMCSASNSGECERFHGGSQVSSMSPSHSEAISIPSTSNPALQAFQLLNHSSQAQSVVASIASDPNIWNAIVQNPALQEFFQSQQTDSSEAEGTGYKNVGDLYHSDSGNGLLDYLIVFQNVKLTVAEMASRLSICLQNMFGFISAPNSSAFGVGSSGNAKAKFMDPFTMGGTFMSLAVLVVMIIVLKRA